MHHKAEIALSYSNNIANDDVAPESENESNDAEHFRKHCRAETVTNGTLYSELDRVDRLHHERDTSNKTFPDAHDLRKCLVL